jgi:hypothetical protein
MSNEEDTITYVYIPDESLYGIILRHGLWSSLIEYYDSGFSYTMELQNDEFIVVDEIGVGYYDEEENN